MLLVPGADYFNQPGVVHHDPGFVAANSDVVAHVTQSGGNRRIHLRERISDILSVRITEEIQS